jgi:phosphoserine phosphatase
MPPQILTTAQFHARVHALNPRIAVFDCDGTLWSGDAGSSFMRWTMQTGLLSPDQIAWLLARYDAYNRRQVNELQICGEMVQVYRGLPIATLRAAAAAFFAQHIEPNIFPEMLQLIRDLQSNGCDIWAVSSTNDWVIEEGVRRFNIPANRVLAARVAAVNNIATDTLIDVPTDEGKVTALRNAGIGVPTDSSSSVGWGLTAPDAVFGNSIHDAAMLAIARSAFPVNPSAELLRHSAEVGWPVYYPTSVAPRPATP